ncbi:MAG: thioredoxin family protein, partial [Pirellulaceae bacterium]|nr:thioredoxin family protein [Pirellulaceae bacterium]
RLGISRQPESTTMVKTASTMLPLGTPAPDFSLRNVDGQMVSLSDFQGQPALLVIVMCNHCPFVKHIAEQLAQLGRDYQGVGVGMVAISSNDIANHPEDSPEQMIHEVEQRGYSFPYLYDEDQDVAIAYQAACTPDFYVFDGDQKLAYRGQLDSSRPDSGIPVTGQDLRAALDAILAGEPAAEHQVPSIGCNIKWKEGAEPQYFNAAGIDG